MGLYRMVTEPKNDIPEINLKIYAPFVTLIDQQTSQFGSHRILVYFIPLSGAVKVPSLKHFPHTEKPVTFTLPNHRKTCQTSRNSAMLLAGRAFAKG